MGYFRLSPRWATWDNLDFLTYGRGVTHQLSEAGEGEGQNEKDRDEICHACYYPGGEQRANWWAWVYT